MVKVLRSGIQHFLFIIAVEKSSWKMECFFFFLQVRVVQVV